MPAAGTTSSRLSRSCERREDFVLPDRSQVTMTVPFMKAYTELQVATCHRRGAHAIGGMAAFIPNRRDPDVTERALAKVTEDKTREAGRVATEPGSPIPIWSRVAREAASTRSWAIAPTN